MNLVVKRKRKVLDWTLLRVELSNGFILLSSVTDLSFKSILVHMVNRLLCVQHFDLHFSISFCFLIMFLLHLLHFILMMLQQSLSIIVLALAHVHNLLTCSPHLLLSLYVVLSDLSDLLVVHVCLLLEMLVKVLAFVVMKDRGDEVDSFFSLLIMFLQSAYELLMIVLSLSFFNLLLNIVLLHLEFENFVETDFFLLGFLELLFLFYSEVFNVFELKGVPDVGDLVACSVEKRDLAGWVLAVLSIVVLDLDS